MSRTKLGPLAGCLVVMLACVTGGRAAEAPPAKPPRGEHGPGGKAKRLLYVVQHRDARDLAAALARHFQGEAEVQALADSPGNCLLIRAAPAAFDEVVKALAQLDRRPRLVSVELLVADVPARKGDGGQPAAEELDERQFTGPAGEVVARVEALRKQGRIGALRRLQVAAVEGQPVSVWVGETAPYVTGIVAPAVGPARRMISYRSTGTLVDLTVRVSPEQVVTMELKLEDARPRVPEAGVLLGKDDSGAAVRATEFLHASLKGTLSIPSGRALAAQGVTTVSPSGQARTLVVVTARVVEADAGAERPAAKAIRSPGP